MAILADYTAGVVSSSGKTITGTGTGWFIAQFREGDIFIAAGYWAIVSEVVSNTVLELVDWAGPTLAGDSYRLRYMSDGSRTSAQARQLIDILSVGAGNIEAFSELMGMPGMVPVFTGPGVMELRPFAAGLQPAGEYDPASVYNIGDLVTYLDNAFGSIIDNNQGNTPPATNVSDDKWQYFPTVPGPKGDTGESAPLGIGTVTQGTTASATITGAVPNQKLNLVLPRGQQGDPGLQGGPGIQGNPGPANTLTIGTVAGGSTAAATVTGSAPNQTLNLVLPKGDPGDAGEQGWSPVFAAVVDGVRVVQQVVDWLGGVGTKPDTGVYVAATGFTTDISEAVNIRGASGAGTGDMRAEIYDPQNIAADAFDRSKQTGTQAISTVTNLQTALDGKFANPTGGTGQYVRGDGSLALFPSIPPGTVTSVGLTVPTGFSVGGSPVTSSGSLSISYASGYQGFTTALAGTIGTALQPGAIGSSIQAFSTQLNNIAALTPADSNFIVGNGTTWVVESGATVRTSLGLGNVATLGVASFGEFNSATASRALGNESIWGNLAVLTDGANIAVDFNLGYDFGGVSNAALALAGNRALSAPSNVRNGKKGVLWFGAATSTRTLTLNAAWVLCTGVEVGPYSITTAQTLGIAYVCRGTTVYVTAILRNG